MEPLEDLPLGFGIALLKNPTAAKYFENCTSEKKQAIISQTHMIESKQEMQAFVDGLPQAAL